MWRRSLQVLAALSDELVLAVGLLLMAGGFYLAWPPGALLVPGAVIVWLALPPRAPLVRRSPRDSTEGAG